MYAKIESFSEPLLALTFWALFHKMTNEFGKCYKNVKKVKSALRSEDAFYFWLLRIAPIGSAGIVIMTVLRLIRHSAVRL